MFTFVTISYNQENYIIEHLESIKYQIITYGIGRTVSYVLSDDASTDQTVAIAEKWLEKNRKLFKEVQVLTATKNQGVVKNYLTAVQAVKTPKYKLLAGDDLYFINNVFTALEWEDVVFTPALGFNAEGIHPDESIPFIMNDGKKMLQYKLSFQNVFRAPGAFFAQEIYQDQTLLHFLSQYKWIEDLPTWYYLFNRKHELAFQVKSKPYVLYRISEGISNSSQNRKRSAFELEEEWIYKTFKMRLRQNRPVDRLSWKFVLLKYHLLDKHKKNVKKYRQALEKETIQAQLHLKYLAARRNAFYQSMPETVHLFQKAIKDERESPLAFISD